MPTCSSRTIRPSSSAHTLSTQTPNVVEYQQGILDKTHTHAPNSACFYLVCDHDPSQNRLEYYLGENFIADMLIDMTKISDKRIEQLKKNQKMNMSAEDMINFQNATHCSICEEPIGKSEKRCRDHDHLTGAYRGCTHQKCNLTYFNNRYIPVVMHNLRGYCSHLIIKKAFEINEHIGNRKIYGIPNSNNKFMSVSLGSLKFIDRMQCMASSLESRVNNLYDKESKYKHFTHMKRELREHIELQCQNIVTSMSS